MEDDFKIKVLVEIQAQRAGARWPSPVPLWDRGEPTQAAHRLGASTAEEVYSMKLEQRVFAAVKRLHEEGRVLFIDRFGYTWVVTPNVQHKASEVVDRPDSVNCPHNWDSL